MKREKTENHQVADDLAGYFTMMVKEEVKIQNKERKTSVKVRFKTEHVNVSAKEEAVKFVALFVYGE